jgi:hypothetical protein
MRNESFLLPYFLRHYEQFAEKIFIFDDASDDDTREIAKANPKVELVEFSSSGIDDLQRAEFFSMQYRIQSRGKANWVACVDCDEFIYHRDLRASLEYQWARDMKVLVGEGFQMLSSTLPCRNGQIYDEIKEGILDPVFSKVAFFNPSEDILFTPGRHGFLINGSSRATWESGFKFLHYRFLSPDFVVNRSKSNWSRFSKKNLDGGFGAHCNEQSVGKYSLSWYKQQVRLRKPVIL